VCRARRITGSAFVTMRLSIEIMNTAIQQARYVQNGYLIPQSSIQSLRRWCQRALKRH
jgi:hypothetical protein